MNLKHVLHKNWTFKLASSNGADVPANIKSNKKYSATVPGTIHTDLAANKLIDDPFYADNELGLQWISDCDWEYETTFNIPKNFDPNAPIALVFDGLDTVADIYINEQSVGKTCNMFRSYRFDIGPHLTTAKNVLRIRFSSPVRYAKAEEARIGKLPVALRSERIYIRKAQYSFGWDWGPEFITSGIWRQVYLENSKAASIETIHCETRSVAGDSAELGLRVSLSGQPGENTSLQIELKNGQQPVISEQVVLGSATEIEHKITVTDPILWYPAGSGDPHLYDLEVALMQNGTVVSVCTKRIGIRTVELQQAVDGKKAFRFVVNDKPVFIKGANWIPAHSFLPGVSDETYRKLITHASNANMNMLRVWGGGIYENDVFYDICDELGLLVWQDFMFACAAYPTHKDFLENVSEEVKQNVSRLSSHPSLAIWCGNNENEWNWYKEQRQPYTQMPGHSIFSQLIPDVLSQADPLRPYWLSTPFGDDEDPNSVSSGNRHQWDIWSMWTDYNEVAGDTSLFVSEFGFQGPANCETLERVIPKKERSFQSRLFDFHNKQVDGNERIIRFLTSHLPLETRWNDFLYLAQLNQGFALKTCLEHWRFSCGKTNGAIIWQLNDCWPVTSWALTDSGKTPKLAYHFVKDSFAPVALSFRKTGQHYQLMAINDTEEDRSVRLEFLVIHPASGKIKQTIRKNIVIKARSCESCHQLVFKDNKDKSEIYLASLYGLDQGLVHRTYLVLQPWKYLKLPPARIKVAVEKRDKVNYVSLRAGNPAFFVDLIAHNCDFARRGMVLLPGEKFEMRVDSAHNEAPDRKKITVHTLNDYLK